MTIGALSLYGIDGPYARRPAFAPTIGAAAGLGWHNAGGSVPEGDLSIMEIRNAACRLATAVMGVGNADGLAAVAVGSVMALGLLARKRGGWGQEMFTSMLSSTAHGLGVRVRSVVRAHIRDAGHAVPGKCRCQLVQHGSWSRQGRPEPCVAI